ncbi:MAG: GNAT family N-acetyltransferase [bacterium]|nr:GNAT family N-acetyltransferase [bacterium]
MSSGVRIRPAEAGDRKAVQSLLAEAIGDPTGRAEGMSDVPGSQVLLAFSEDEAEPVGICRLVPDSEANARNCACMDVLFVSPRHRHGGTGDALLKAVRAAIVEHGFESLIGYFPGPVPLKFVEATGGRGVRNLLLFFHERIEQFLESKLPKGLRVRSAATPEDLPVLAHLYNEIFEDRWNFRLHSGDNVAAWFEERDTAPENCLILEVEEGGSFEAAGMVVLALNPDRISAGEAVAYIPDIGVRPAYRRRGFGRVLIEAAARHALGKDLQVLELIVDREDERARGFYVSLGFEESIMISVYEWRADSAPSSSETGGE